MSNPFWIMFKDRPSACVEAPTGPEARELAEKLTGNVAVSSERIPYPAEPRLNRHLHTYSGGTQAECPSFCFAPHQCKGRTSCPQRYACSE
jgi:hypothetical protein